FGACEHSILLSIPGEKLHVGRCLHLVGRILQAGYLEDWRGNATLSGCPQGGVASAVMSYIYLDRLDRFVEQHLIPDYTRGDRRRENPAYTRMKVRIAYTRKHGDREGLRRLRRER